jgi:hypothetical protein
MLMWDPRFPQHLQEKHNSQPKAINAIASMDAGHDGSSMRGRALHAAEDSHGHSFPDIPVTTQQVMMSGSVGGNNRVLPPVSSIAASSSFLSGNNGQQAAAQVGSVIRKGGMEINGNSKEAFESFVAHTVSGT